MSPHFGSEYVRQDGAKQNYVKATVRKWEAIVLRGDLAARVVGRVITVGLKKGELWILRSDMPCAPADAGNIPYGQNIRTRGEGEFLL